MTADRSWVWGKRKRKRRRKRAGARGNARDETSKTWFKANIKYSWLRIV